MKGPYPITPVEDPQRPYRLWDAKEKAPIRYRYYGNVKRAHIGALIEARYAKVGVTVEVYDARTARLLGQYTRRTSTVDIWEPS